MEDDMQLINVARRAGLGDKITNGYMQTIEKLNIAKSYNKKVYSLLKDDKDSIGFHYSIQLIGLLSILEAYITDLLLEYIICYPGHSGEKSIKLSSLASAGSVAEFVKKIAEKKVNDLAYKTFNEYHNEFSTIIGLKKSININLLEKISELKATRDIYVHAGGKCNERYIQKSGTLARAKIDNILPLDSDYLEFAILTIEEYISSVYDQISETFKNYGKVKAFKEMWNFCELNNVVVFDDVWDSTSEPNMIRPKEFAFEYAWSGSEQAAFDFFLGIYSTDHPKRKTDLMYAMRRWPPSTNVGKIIISWMESPFSF